jgi:predicted nucleic acid-binding Zn ribbon protein
VNLANDHRHCKVCGRVSPPGEETCSKACRTTYQQNARTRRMWTYLFYAVALIVAVIFLSVYV